MDGFRDRLRERSAERSVERYDRESRYDDRDSRYDDRDSRYDDRDRYAGDRESRYDDRYDSRSRRSSYDSSEDVSKAIDSSNAKQLREIKELFLDAKDDRYTSEKQIIRAVSELEDKVADKVADKVVDKMPKPEVTVANQENSSKLDEQIIANTNAIMSVNSQILENTNSLLNASLTQAAPAASSDVDNSEVVKLAQENNSILMQLAEEQLSMLIRGNSAMLSQISQSTESNEELLRTVLSSINNMPSSTVAPIAMDPMMEMPMQNNEEVLQAVLQNNTLLNTLRSEVAAVQGDLRDAVMQQQTAMSGMEPLMPVAEEPLDALDSGDKSNDVDFDAKFAAVDENVHKECVKVYRNVQALMEEQSRTIDKSVKTGTTPVKVVCIITLILSLLNFAATLIFSVLPNLGM